MIVKRYILFLLSFPLALGVSLSGCGTIYKEHTVTFSAKTPEDTVSSFYDWYTSYPGNPLTDRAYLSNEYLTEEFIQRMDAVLSSSDFPGYDPFLCAQDIPERFTISAGPRLDEEDVAIVLVDGVWNSGTEYELVNEMEVVLHLEDGVWKIADIQCGRSEGTVTSIRFDHNLTPLDVVERFYDWYLAYLSLNQDLTSCEIHNPMVDGTYRSNEFLSTDFVLSIEDFIKRNQDEYGCMPYDPFLCAQDIPESVNFVGVQIVTGGKAIIDVETSFPDRTFTVVLNRINEEWKITDINCLSQDPVSSMPEGPIPTTPEGTVCGFYGWYLWYAHEIGNPLVNGVYRESEYLTDDLIQNVDDTLASFEHGGFDPFLCAQDIPQSYTLSDVVVSGDSASVTVSTDFKGHEFTVVLRQLGGRWMISEIICDGGQPNG